MTHKIIHTSDYLLVVDDSEIKEDCVAIHLGPLGEQEIVTANGECKLDKKIIAHLPLNGSPILEGVPLLPSLEQEDKELYYQKQVMQPYSVESQSYTSYENGFIDGYNKAKEKYKYTEDDIRKAIRYGFDVGFCSNSSNKTKNDLQSEETFIQSLSQPKMPVGFECEIEYFYMASRMFYKDADWVKCNKNQYESIREEIPTCPLKKVHKEISTPEGHTQWVGKYIY